jgi:hypothetical protein
MTETRDLLLIQSRTAVTDETPSYELERWSLTVELPGFEFKCLGSVGETRKHPGVALYPGVWISPSGKHPLTNSSSQIGIPCA